jgi:hypothetical protein
VNRQMMRAVPVGGLFLLAALMLPGMASAQALPTPGAFVRNLDVRCYKIPNQPRLGVNLRLDHLNPALVGMGLPFEQVDVAEPQELCVPVYKNGIQPPATVFPFIRFLDWKCYGITGPSLNLPLNLNQLNPVITNILGATANIVVREPQQLCVPVQKNNSVPPAAVLQLLRWLDVKCYRVDNAPPIPAGAAVTLSHLNPLITNPAETVNFLAPAHQLCVPVMKNQVPPPANVAQIVRYSDVLCYKINGQPLNRNFNLTHQNPVLLGMGLPVEAVQVTDSTELCVPVAKNGFFPPG